MNVEEANGVKMNTKIIELVFHKSHLYYAAGLRLYFIIIPLFAWMINSYALIVVTPIYLWLVEDYEDLSFLEGELEKMYIDTNHGKYKEIVDMESGLDMTKIAVKVDEKKA
jgi:uncharacterized membrane protein